MAGVMGGTAILKGLQHSNKLKTITLTINNDCNLGCPHCYLQYMAGDISLSKGTIDSIFKSDFEHLAIVGKEPLLNSSSIKLFGDLVNLAKATGRTVSVITNGFGLNQLPLHIAKELDYIDVSFDAGPKFYESYRKGSFAKIIRGITRVQQSVNIPINILHTISDANVDFIDDMMDVDRFASFNTILFSPYIKVNNDGRNYVNELSLESILHIFGRNEEFLTNSKALIAFDIFENGQSTVNRDVISQIITLYGLERKTIIIDKNPLEFGLLRVTFDDYVLSPYDSVHPSSYRQSGLKASECNLNKVYDNMLAS